MSDVLQTPAASVVLLLAGVAILILIGIYVIGKVRAEATDNTPPASSLLSNFDEMHTQGELSDEEYRTIKSVLAQQLQRELNEKGDSG